MRELRAEELLERPPAGVLTRPTSVMLYARSRPTLDRIALVLSRRIDSESIWVEVRDGGGRGPDSDEADAIARLPPERVYIADGPEALIPDTAALNLGLWTQGRGGGRAPAADDPSDLVWLPRVLREMTERPPGYGGLTGAAVVSRVERLVFRFPEGADDARRLVRVMNRRNWTVIVTLLIRPVPEFGAIFEHVFRVRGEPTNRWENAVLVSEREPDSPGWCAPG